MPALLAPSGRQPLGIEFVGPPGFVRARDRPVFDIERGFVVSLGTVFS